MAASRPAVDMLCTFSVLANSFLGAAPAHDPVVAVLVMIRKPKRSLGYYGGTVAGPAVREIIQKTLAYWDITPDRDPSSVAMLAMKTATD